MNTFPRTIPFILFSGLLTMQPALRAQSAPESDTTTAAVEKLPDIVVGASIPSVGKYQTPQVIETITGARMEETINVMDTEDAVKYMPSVFLRKRNYGDTQAILATRVWGTSSSARTLIYGDGVLLSALIANNNNIGGPRWGLVAPIEIERVDMLYGPFSAAYPGNSMGGVMEIVTRMPDKLEATISQTEAWQNFSQYGTKDDYLTHQTAVSVGNRQKKLSYWVSANYQDSHSQPLSYVTSPTFPTGTTGGYVDFNKLNAPANVLGAGGMLHTKMANAKLKLAYDFTPTLRGSYSFGVWRNDANSSVQTYMTNSLGQPTYAGQAGFASANYELFQQHTSHSITLRTDTKKDWNFEIMATRYSLDQDKQRFPLTASGTNAITPSFSTNGRVAILEGTNWKTLDLKGTWLPDGIAGKHAFSFGVHGDYYRLYNPTYNTSDWKADGPYTSLFTEGDGKTRTVGGYVQDVWQAAPKIKVTYGVRYDDWSSYDGYNVNGAITVVHPTVGKSNFSPKATAEWTVSHGWTVTASVGQAYRYPTSAELYQLVSTGTTFTSPSPNLKPDDSLSTELRIEHQIDQGHVRVSIFQDNVHDAIIAQFKPLAVGSTQLYSFISNVDHVRARGVEFVAEERNVGIHGLDFSGSFTYLDARTLALSGEASASAPPGSAVGKFLPNIPMIRGTGHISYRPNDRLTLSVAGRYSSLLYTTLDNSDVNPNTYQGFASWFVADVRSHYRFNDKWSASLGIDNILDREYFLFHVFPKRTAVADVKFSF